MSWSLKGSYVETCSCDLICPCNASFDHGATYDYCRIVLAFNIREGEIEGTDTAGCKIVAIADTPKVMTEGKWRLGVFVDDQSTEEQADKLVKVFSGQLGGPMGGWRRSWGSLWASSAPRLRSTTTAFDTASASATLSTSRSRTSSPG